MSTIKVTCIDQTMALTSTPVITSGGLHEDDIVFSFCPLWDGYTRTAVFWRTANDPHYRVLDETNTCEIPDEVLVAEGSFYFGVFGVNAEGVQRTTGVLKYNIGPGVMRADTKPLEPTPDIYVQLLAAYASAVAGVEGVVGAVQHAVDTAEQALAATILDGTLTDPNKPAPAAAVGELDTVLRGLIGERAQVVSGSYTGTGVSTDGNTLTFPFEPKFVYIAPENQDGANQAVILAIKGMTCAYNTMNSASSFDYRTHLSWGDTSLTLTCSLISGGVTSHDHSAEMNVANRVYRYIAIG